MNRAIHASPRRPCHPVSRGFSLVELIVVVVIVLILLAVALPAFQMIRSSSRNTVCLNNLRQLGLATLNYDAANDRLPMGVLIPEGHLSIEPDELYGWSTELLPFLEQNPLFEIVNSDAPVTLLQHVVADRSGQVAESLATPLPGIRCPSDDIPMTNTLRAGSPAIGKLAAANYVGANHVGICQALRDAATRRPPLGTFHGIDAETMDSFVDGTSHTVIYSERIYGAFDPDQFPAAAGLWFGCRGPGNPADPAVPGIHDITFAAAGGVNRLANPIAPALVRHGVSSGHPGWVNVALADGSVRNVTNQVQSWFDQSKTAAPPEDTADYGIWERLIDLDDSQVVTFE